MPFNRHHSLLNSRENIKEVLVMSINKKNFLRLVKYGLSWNHAWAEVLANAKKEDLNEVSENTRNFVLAFQDILDNNFKWKNQEQEDMILSYVDNEDKIRDILELSERLLAAENRPIKGIPALDVFSIRDDINDDLDIVFDHVSTTGRVEVYVDNNTINISINRPNDRDVFSVDLIQKDDYLSFSHFYYKEDKDMFWSEYYDTAPTTEKCIEYFLNNWKDRIRLRHLMAMFYTVKSLMFFAEDQQVTLDVFKKQLHAVGSLILEASSNEMILKNETGALNLMEMDCALNDVVRKTFLEVNDSIENRIVEFDYSKGGDDINQLIKFFSLPQEGIARKNMKVYFFLCNDYPLEGSIRNHSRRDMTVHVIYGLSKDDILRVYNERKDDHRWDPSVSEDIDPYLSKDETMLLTVVNDMALEYKDQCGAFVKKEYMSVVFEDSKEAINRLNEQLLTK